jgi:hypothetical protein
MSPCRRLTLAALLLAFAVGVGAGPAVSAEVVDNRPFLMRLFGLGKPMEPTAPPPGAKIIRVPSTPAKPKPVSHPKNADARIILVFGDRFAADLGRGLEVAFADSPDVAVEVKSQDPSGLADRRPFDWKGWLETRLGDGKRPVAVVAMLGLADAAPIEAGEQTFPYPSSDWETVYRARIDELVRLATERALPLSWVGLVPVASADTTADLSYIDSVIRGEVGEKGATYVDVWEAFASAGSFTFNGPDIDGQDRQLRLKDGIGFSRSGARKLAFFAEQELRRILSAPASGLTDTVSPQGMVMLLNDPAAPGESELLPLAALKKPKTGTPLYRLVVDGEPLPPALGRADDLPSLR